MPPCAVRVVRDLVSSRGLLYDGGTTHHMQTHHNEIDRYLRTGDHDSLYTPWPGDTFLDRAKRGDTELRQALIAEVRKRTEHAAEAEGLAGLDIQAFTRAKVTPMVRGLFAHAEQEAVLDVLGRSVVFLTPSNIESVLAEMRWLDTAWTVANLYLASVGAEPLASDAPKIVGLSEETTCYVSAEYFRRHDPFDDFVVHEAAHIFHNCKRRTVGLRETSRREWLLKIEFAKRETFAYACEAYGCILERGKTAADRARLLHELEQGALPADNRVEPEVYLGILREAVAARNGWKRILERCSIS